jgi:hypothetical protein
LFIYDWIRWFFTPATLEDKVKPGNPECLVTPVAVDELEERLA